MSRYQYHACERCGCPGVERAYIYCGRCEGKRRGLAEELTREPGSDDQRCVHCRGVITSGTVCPSCVALLELHGGDAPERVPPRPSAVGPPTCSNVLPFQGVSADQGSISLPGVPTAPQGQNMSARGNAPLHNGYWLYHDARKQGDLDAVVAFGQEHGFPRMLKDWSRGMVQQANQARAAAIP